MKLYENGVYLLNGKELIEDGAGCVEEILSKTGKSVTKEEAAKNTIAYGIMESHNVSGNMDKLQIKFDKLTSHDITFVGIIQTARASGLEKFPIQYVLTNCHNSLCAVGGTINDDDHLFGLTCAKRYGGMYVPPHPSVCKRNASRRGKDDLRVRFPYPLWRAWHDGNGRRRAGTCETVTGADV